MKIIGEQFDTEENISKLLNRSVPRTDFDLTVDSIKEYAGWVYVSGTFDGSEYSINYSSAVFPNIILIEFFKKLVGLRGELVLFFDYEGSYPMLYAKRVDKDTLRFVFAHDYILYENDEDYDDCLDYKIEFDVLIKKKDLLEKYYNILSPFIKNYNEKFAKETFFNLNKAKQCLNIIKNYIDEK